MSAYKECETEFRNLDSLKKALGDCGFAEVEVSGNGKVNNLQLAGFMGRDQRQAAIKLAKSVYGGFEDTGFYWDAGTQTYKAVISTHDGYGNFGAQTLAKVKQRYALHEIRRLATAKGYTIRETKDESGSIRLQLTHR